MGTVLAVKKDKTICIGADSMTISGGGRKHTADHVTNHEKIVKVGESFIGTAGHPAWPLILKKFFSEKDFSKNLGSRDQIFVALLELHQSLKDSFFLSPFESDEDEFESSRFEAILISPKGIFSSYRLRSVQQFVRFNAVGSGSSYALGALHALYDRLGTAREIAEKALEVAAEFDDSSSLPGTFHEIRVL